MKNLTFHIVGLTHNDVKGHEVEYAKEAEGRTICLVPDDANTFDMLAVKAYDKQQLIGYVSALEGEDVRALIIARKERNLRTRCIGCNSKNEGDKAGLQLMVRALSDVSDEEMEHVCRTKKRHRPTDRPITTALYLLRAKQLGLTIDEMEQLDEGMIFDMITEKGNDEESESYNEIATQDDFDRF